MKRLIFSFLALCLFAAQSVYAQPEPFWTQVSMPVFFDYSATTQAQPPANGPYTFRFPGASAILNDTSGCYYNQFASSAANPKRPYWFNNGVLASGVIPRNSPSVGTVFEDPVWVGTAMRGFSFLGSFTSGNYTPLDDHLTAWCLVRRILLRRHHRIWLLPRFSIELHDLLLRQQPELRKPALPRRKQPFLAGCQ